MAMERKISSKKYLIAFVLTLLVFGGGVILGFTLDDVRLEDSKQLALKEKVNLRSIQLQQQYIDSGQADCKTLNKVLEENINQLARKMETVQEYDKNSVFNQEEFDLQLQDYFLTEIQFLLTSEEIDQKCSRDSVKVVYFYDENNQDTQGDILAYLKKKFGSRLLVFSFDSTFQHEPMIPILLSSHEITKYPSLVVNGKTYSGHQPVKKLMGTICDEFKKMDDVVEECVAFDKVN